MSARRSNLHARRRHAAAAATAAAGVVHLAATGPHLSQGWLLAAGFLATGVVQLVLGLGLAVRRGGRLIGVGVGVVHLMALSAWVLSRTVGLPAFLHPGVEPVGLADTIAASMELAAVVLLAWRASRPAPMGRSPAASVTVVTFAWVLAITGTAAGLGDLASTEHGHDASEHEATDHHDAAPPDAGAPGGDDTRGHETTAPRPGPGPQHDVVDVDAPQATTPPDATADHTHVPGQEH